MMHGDLFSGIGGFALAARWMGWRTAWFSEIDPFASRVLAHHWPDVTNYGDITRIDWATVEPVDILTAGFPCQPHSVAGLRKASQDNRDLSGEVVRAIGSLRPRWALLENVPGLLGSEKGQFFRRFLGQVAEIGYDAEWGVLSASDVGAPHKRERLWIVAYPHGEQVAALLNWSRLERGQATAPAWAVDVVDADCRRTDARASDVADAGSAALQGRKWVGHDSTQVYAGEASALGSVAERRTGHRRGVDQWHTEPDVGRVAHGVSHRVDRLTALGNAIVPQCAYEIFQHITAAPRRTETR
jgi:DNA (cytosine-5)-methyltransferase 1